MKKLNQKLQQSKASSDHANKRKIEQFKEICGVFKPVFRHFFYENFANPCQQLERRLAYTRSCATSSMIGYILGKFF